MVYFLVLAGLLFTAFLSRCPPVRARIDSEILKKGKLIRLIILVGDILALLLWITDGTGGVIVDGSYILRNEKGEGSRELTLTAKKENGEEAEADLTVEPCRYSEEELAKLYEELVTVVSKEALADNPSWEQVTSDLNLMESVEGFPFTLSWKSGNLGFITGNGRVADYEAVAEYDEKEALVALRMKAVYYDFVREDTFYAGVCPVKAVQTFAGEAAAALKEAESDASYEDRVYLPAAVSGEAVSWQEKKENTGRTIFLMSVGCAALVWFLKGREKKKQAEERAALMAAEYPAVISKLTLYLGAGMNIRSAWEKVAKEGVIYEKEQNLGVPYIRRCYTPAGKWMVASRRQMVMSAWEEAQTAKVYSPHHPFGAEPKEGNAALLLQLRQESFLALEEQTAAVRKAGEEMGTKLLLPMMLMMGMVMVLIMVPAFLSF